MLGVYFQSTHSTRHALEDLLDEVIEHGALLWASVSVEFPRVPASAPIAVDTRWIVLLQGH